MNIYDVSKKAGVSIATVSRVLNHNPNVSEKTRLKVMRVIEETDYTPNIFARGLGLNTMRTIGVLCADSSDMYLANAVYYLERELSQNGYNCFLCCTGYKLEDKIKYMNLLLSKRVDGIVLVGSHFIEPKDRDNRYIYEAAERVPVMLMNGILNRPNIYSVVLDDFSSIYQAVTAMIEQDHKEILFLYPALSFSNQRKLSGYRQALIDKGLEPKKEYIICQEKDILKTKSLLTDLYDSHIIFNGLMASEDLYGIAALKFALSKGIKVPDDFSIVGYNNSLLSVSCEPELSTIDSKVEALSMTTVTTLMGVLNGSNVPSKTTISADFIKRATTLF